MKVHLASILWLMLSLSYVYVCHHWDGEDCGAISTCFEFTNPPWFGIKVPDDTTDHEEPKSSIFYCGFKRSNSEVARASKLMELYMH